MACARTCSFVLAALLLGCGSDDESRDASAVPQDEPSTLVAKLGAASERGVLHRCECLVEQGVLYDAIEPCLADLGWAPSASDCLSMAFSDDGTPELISTLECVAGHLEDANACAESVTCAELLDGTCDATFAANPCGEGTVDLYAFIFDHCPEFSLR